MIGIRVFSAKSAKFALALFFCQFRAEQNVTMRLIFLYLGQFSSLRKTFDFKMTAWICQKEWYQNLDMCTRTPICGDISQNVGVNSLLCQPVYHTSFYIPSL